MSDRIVLTGLRVRGNHGVFEHERRDGQDFVVDLTVWAETRTAGRSDQLADTVDYGALALLATDVVAGPAVNLIEALAARIVERVLDFDPRIEAAEVTVHKPGAPIPLDFADVAVVVRRGRP
jgi:dihydroneopterin aldolase